MTKKDKSPLQKILFGKFTEEELYEETFQKELWTLDEFSALMNNISPQKFSQAETSFSYFSKLTPDECKKITSAQKTRLKFITDLEKEAPSQNLFFKDASGKTIIVMSPWRFIKWAAEKQMPTVKFINALPLHLLELLLEFAPLSSALRNSRKDSLAYHRMLYLKNAEKLLKLNGKMTPIQVYNHPLMKNIQRNIREWGGNYKKRTFTESWLPKLVKRNRGRPNKIEV